MKDEYPVLHRALRDHGSSAYPPVEPEKDYPQVEPYKIIVTYEVLAGSEEEAIDQFDDWLNFDEIRAIPLDEAEAPSIDTITVDELVNFVRTANWSSGMLEDIAELVRHARPGIEELGDFADEDETELEEALMRATVMMVLPDGPNRWYLEARGDDNGTKVGLHVVIVPPQRVPMIGDELLLPDPSDEEE